MLVGCLRQQGGGFHVKLGAKLHIALGSVYCSVGSAVDHIVNLVARQAVFYCLLACDVEFFHIGIDGIDKDVAVEHLAYLATQLAISACDKYSLFVHYSFIRLSHLQKEASLRLS